MNKTWGLLLALMIGTLIGWVAQQFWIAAADHSADWTTERLMSHNAIRLTKLTQPGLIKVPADVEVIGPWKDEVDQLLDYVTTGRVDVATQKYREHLNEYSQDLSLSRAIAEKWLKSGDYEAALILLYEQRLFIAFEHEDALLKLIFETVEKIERVLFSKNKIESLISLYRLLISLHGDHTPYYLSLTYWLIESGDLYSAGESLAGAVNDIAFQQEVEALQSRIDETDILKKEGEVSIPLSKVGEHFVVEVLLNEHYPVKLMIDTGASVSVLSRSVLKSELLNMVSSGILANARPVQMNTANGQVTGRQILIQSFRLGDIQLKNVGMGILPLPDFKFDGLLGMNVLSRFEFFIDQEKQLLLLR